MFSQNYVDPEISQNFELGLGGLSCEKDKFHREERQQWLGSWPKCLKSLWIVHAIPFSERCFHLLVIANKISEVLETARL